MSSTDALLLLGALLVDRGIGEWPSRVHPVVWMGKLVRYAERLGPGEGRVAPFLHGVAMALFIPGGAAAVAWAAVQVPVAGPLIALFLLKSSLALRLLGEAGEGVARPLAAGDLEEGRARLSWLCSRDASSLSSSQVAAGAVESLAENLSDSFVAPIFWFLVAGVPGALAYRAVNTLDAMIGYHGRYEWLGKASARLDDLANLVPARLTALALLLVAGPLRLDLAGGARALVRDRQRTESPNAGWPMATMAGLLGVCLEKPGHYALGRGPPPGAEHIRAAWRACRAAAVLLAAAALVLELR